MQTYKVEGNASTGQNFRFFVKCETPNIAQSVIINRLMQVKQPAETILVTEATPNEIAKAIRILVVEEKVGA